MSRETFGQVITTSAFAARAEKQVKTAGKEWQFIFSSKAP
jgi:hypothetical protein